MNTNHIENGSELTEAIDRLTKEVRLLRVELIDTIDSMRITEQDDYDSLDDKFLNGIDGYYGEDY